jgi:hypothetical protein
MLVVVVAIKSTLLYLLLDIETAQQFQVTNG